MEVTPSAEDGPSEMQITPPSTIHVRELFSSQFAKGSLAQTHAVTGNADHGSQMCMACRDMLRRGSPQALSYAAVLMMPQLSGNGAMDLLTRNYVFKAGFWGWLIAQTLKVVRD